MKEQGHIIGREVMEITVPDRANAMSVQNRVSEIVRQKLNPALNKVFSKISENGKTLRIDHLTIDLGTITPAELENGLVQKAIYEAEVKIRKLISDNTNRAASIVVDGKESAKKENIAIVSSSQDVLEKFIYFLRSGYLPWWHKRSTKDDLSDIFSQVLEIDQIQLNKRLIPVFSETTVRSRLVFQFNNKQLDFLLKKIDESYFNQGNNLFHLLFPKIDQLVTKDRFITSFYEILLQYLSFRVDLNKKNNSIRFLKEIILKRSPSLSADENERTLIEVFKGVNFNETNVSDPKTTLVKMAIIEAAFAFSSPGKKLIRFIKSIPTGNEPELQNLILKMIEAENARAYNKVTDNKNGEMPIKETVLTESEGDTDKFTRETETRDSIKETDDAVSLPFSKPSVDAEEIFINNAGLVILHPFLRFFFEGLKLLDKDLRFKNIDNQFKAVHLLQFMATGQESTPEYDLSLNKILCGLDISEPIPKEMLITDEEKAECVHLLSTVLERWEALKTSKPEALRHSYIQREGALKKTGQGWNLNIERNTFDVMLEKLPWTISIIKFPWSAQMLFVEW